MFKTSEKNLHFQIQFLCFSGWATVISVYGDRKSFWLKVAQWALWIMQSGRSIVCTKTRGCFFAVIVSSSTCSILFTSFALRERWIFQSRLFLKTQAYQTRTSVCACLKGKSWNMLLFGWMVLILGVFDSVYSPKQKMLCSTLRWGPPLPVYRPALPLLAGRQQSGALADLCLAWQQCRVWGCGSTESLMCWERWGERMCWSDLEKPAGRGRGVPRGGYEQRGGGGEWLAFTLYIQCIILPQSTSVAKLREWVHVFF